MDETFSDVGRECRRTRALLETETSFWNTSEDLMDDHSVQAALKLTHRENNAVMLLDKHTCLDSCILNDAKKWHDAIRALRDLYVEFYVQGKKYNRKCLETS